MKKLLLVCVFLVLCIGLAGCTDGKKKEKDVNRICVKDEEGKVLLSLDDIDSVSLANDVNLLDGTRGFGTAICFTSDGAQKLQDATAENFGKNLYVYKDDKVIETIAVSSPITDGEIVLKSAGSYKECVELTAKLNDIVTAYTN